MTEGSQSNSVGTLVADTVGHLHQLMRKEVQLARAEIEEKVSKAAFAVVLIVIAALAALTGLNVLAGAATAALIAAGVAPWLSAIVVALAFGVVAIAATVWAKSILSNLTLAPSKTVNALKRDGHILKETIHDQ